MYVRYGTAEQQGTGVGTRVLLRVQEAAHPGSALDATNRNVRVESHLPARNKLVCRHFGDHRNAGHACDSGNLRLGYTPSKEQL